MASLFEIGFDSFEENDENLFAYVSPGVYNKELLEEVLQKYHLEGTPVSEEMLENKNWNEEWEKYFDPVFVDDKVYIRATFHTSLKEYPYEIIINPKMSFGTGHHETTTLMIREQLKNEHTGKKVFDVGTGTGILAIMAAKLGASEVFAIDIDQWSFENSQENVKLNHCENISVQKGSVEEISDENQYDIILANITRNILLHDMPYYNKYCLENGRLLLSGFYEFDAEEVRIAAERNGFALDSKDEFNSWCCLSFTKK